MAGSEALTPAPGGVYVTVWVQPRASRTKFAGLHDGALRVQLAAPPVDGEANAELVRFLAKTLSLPRQAVELVSGASSRKKRLLVTGVTLIEAAERLLQHS